MARERRAIRSGVLVAAMLCTASLAAAQARAPRRGWRPEIDFGAAWTAGTSFGTAGADLTTPTGGVQPLFSTSNRLAAGTSLEVQLPFRVRGRLRAEAVGSWGRSQLESKISGDFEGAAPITIAMPVTRVTVEGAALWYWHARGRLAPFLRGAAGWGRDLSAGNVLAADGVIVNAGLGMKYWWRDGAATGLRRFGLRSELRVVTRSGGLTLGSTAATLSIAATAGAVIGF